MNLFVWNIPEASTEQEVREFLEHELGHYAKSVTVNEAGTPRAHATVELLSDGPYIGEVIARELQHKLLRGARLEVSAELFGGQEPSSKE
jgi:hypothetical protein